MLFLSLDYQLFLILVLVFSSLLFISSIAIKHQKVGLRAFELAFSIPFFLTAASFLTSPYNREGASELLIFAHLALILFCTVILFIRKETDSQKLLYLLPFIVIGAVLITAGSSLGALWYVVLHALDLGLVVINLAMVVHTLFQKEKDRLLAYLGMFTMSSALGIWFLSGSLTMESLILIGTGYGSCTVFVYKNTLGIFFKEYQKNSESMQRINASIHTEVIRRVEEIERSNRKLLELSKTDSLTGLYVKTAIIKSLETNLERSPQTSLSVLMMDIDNFKQINDTMGHQVGDRSIRALSTLIQGAFRKDDVLGRYGGDEFMVLLPGATPVKAYLIADRFRQFVQSKSIPQITISVGIANYPEDGKAPAVLIEQADKALYASKQKGRNQVTLYSSIKESQPNDRSH